VVEFKEMPALICLKCVKELQQAYQFRTKCIEVDEYFRCEVPQKSWPKLGERDKVFEMKNDDNCDREELQIIDSEYLIRKNAEPKTVTKSTNKKMKM
jgi:Zinc-finger associated domain (zf-AD)